MLTRSRLIEAAENINRSGEYIRMEVKQTGIRLYMLREIDGVVQQTENYTPWNAIEGATQNPLLICTRDLINQMDEMTNGRQN